MVLYIDFEWETEPLKMALSKNFTLPEKCKNHRSAPTVRCWSVALTQNCLEVVLDLTRDWRGPLLAPPLAPSPAPSPPRAPEAGRHANSCGERSSLLQMKKRRKQQKGKKGDIQDENHFATFSPKKRVFRKNLSLLIICPFLCVFLWMQLYVFFTLILFFFPYTPLPHRLTPPTPPPPNPKSSRREAIPMRSHAQKKRQK